MVLPTRKTTIKGCEYTIQLMDGDRALTRFGTLAKFLGGPFGRLLASGMEKAHNAAPELVAAALSELGQHLSTPEFRELVYDMLAGSFAKPKGAKEATPLVTEDGNIELFKGHFRGEIGALLQLAWFALRENFESFSDALPGLGGLLQLAQERALRRLSQEDTTGGSPDSSLEARPPSTS
jgi:hypothetical protein